MNIFTKIWDWITDFVYTIASFFILLLPESPFQKWANSQMQNSPFENILNYINYFVPVGPMVIFFTGYVVCVAIWYVARWALRWVKYID